MKLKIKRYRAVSAVVTLLFFGGCEPPITIKKNDLAWKEQEAKLHDLPFLFNFRMVQFDTFATDDSKNTAQMEYAVKSSLDEAKQFYISEMERLGWRQIESFLGTEFLGIFEKPSKRCSVSIKIEKGMVRVSIFVKYR